MKVNETWRKCYNVELVQLFGDFDTLSFIIISWLKQTGQVNRMDSKRAVSHVIKNNPHGS